MADTGYNWAAWASAGSGVDGDPTIATGADATSDAIDLDVKVACEIGLSIAYPDNAPTGVVTIYVLGDVDGTHYETTNAAPWAFTITPVRNATIYRRFSIDPGSYGEVKVMIANAAGHTLTAVMTYRTATIPAAS